MKMKGGKLLNGNDEHGMFIMNRYVHLFWCGSEELYAIDCKNNEYTRKNQSHFLFENSNQEQGDSEQKDGRKENQQNA